MAVIDLPSPLFSLNHFTFQDHVHTHIHTVGMHTHTHAQRFNMDKWALGRRIQLASLSLSLPLALRVSLPLRVSQDMPGLNAFQSSPHTHCRLSFKGLLTVMSSIYTPSSLPLSLLFFLLYFSVCFSVFHNHCVILLKPSVFLHQSLKLCGHVVSP